MISSRKHNSNHSLSSYWEAQSNAPIRSRKELESPSPEHKPISKENYVSILKRPIQEKHLLKSQCDFDPINFKISHSLVKRTSKSPTKSPLKPAPSSKRTKKGFHFKGS